MQAIVGANAFAHESGIHQDGMLKNKDTYEIISPEEIGLFRTDSAGIVMGAPAFVFACADLLLPLEVKIHPCVLLTWLAPAAGKHSGRAALRTKLQSLGFDLAQEQLDDVFKRFKVGPCSITAICCPAQQLHVHCPAWARSRANLQTLQL